MIQIFHFEAMMNYYAKFQIAECVFNKITNPAFIGIFTYENGKVSVPPSLSPDSFEQEIFIRRSISIGSYLGGGSGFPSRDYALEILLYDHRELIEAFIKTIPQDEVILFEDGSRYSHVMMQILVHIFKKFDKHVTSIALLPPSFERKKALNIFNQSWEVIKELSDEYFLLDMEIEQPNYQEILNLKGNTFYDLRWNKLFQKMTDKENGFKLFETPREHGYPPIPNRRV